jgi:adenylate cyclase class 2
VKSPVLKIRKGMIYMTNEIEIKLKHNDFESLIKKINEKGCQSCIEQSTCDVYYDNGDLMRRGFFFRFRHIGSEILFTFKGPNKTPRGSAVRIREEEEFKIVDITVVSRVFSILRLQPVIRVNKSQKNFELDGCKIYLDEVEGLGKFVEIEGPSIEQVEKVRTILDLNSSPVCQLGYAQMIAAQMGRII